LTSLQKLQQREKPKTGLRILVVDDDSLNQRLLSIVLASDNHIVTFAYSGSEALSAIDQNQFDLIFMDIQIPDMDGFEVSKRIRNSKSPNSQTPIVALTALSTYHKKLQDYLNNGLINDCIYKPFETIRIEQIIASIRTGKGIALTEYSHTTQMDPDKASILETKNILPFFSNDPEKYRQLFRDFLQTLPERIMKMKQSEQEQDWKSLSTLAHNLTGIAENFGAMKLSVLARQLDNEAGEKNMTVAHELLEKIEENIPALQESFIVRVEKPNSLNQLGNYYYACTSH